MAHKLAETMKTAMFIQSICLFSTFYCTTIYKNDYTNWYKCFNEIYVDQNFLLGTILKKNWGKWRYHFSHL